MRGREADISFQASRWTSLRAIRQTASRRTSTARKRKRESQDGTAARSSSRSRTPAPRLSSLRAPADLHAAPPFTAGSSPPSVIACCPPSDAICRRLRGKSAIGNRQSVNVDLRRATPAVGHRAPSVPPTGRRQTHTPVCTSGTSAAAFAFAAAAASAPATATGHTPTTLQGFRSGAHLVTGEYWARPLQASFELAAAMRGTASQGMFQVTAPSPGM